MGAGERFNRYMDHSSAELGPLDRHAGLRSCRTGLMLPLARTSVEPMPAYVDPMRAGDWHRVLHHFVAKSKWSGQELLRRVCQWAVPQMDFSRGGWWTIADLGFPRKGKHSVGAARQHGGVLSKQVNCQVDRVVATEGTAGRRSATPLRAGRCRPRRGHRLPPSVERRWVAVPGGRDFSRLRRVEVQMERLMADKPVGGKRASSNARHLPCTRTACPARQPCLHSGTGLTRSSLCGRPSAKMLV